MFEGEDDKGAIRNLKSLQAELDERTQGGREVGAQEEVKQVCPGRGRAITSAGKGA